MNNFEAAAMFLELADLLDLAGELSFRSSSYRKAASSLSNLEKSFEDVVKNGEFDKIPGVGKAIKEKLKVIAETGSLPTLEKWRKDKVYLFYPWLEVYGVTPRPLGILIRKLDASDIKDLQAKLRGFELKKLTGQSKMIAKEILKRIN